MADFSASARSATTTRRSWLQRVQSWLRPSAPAPLFSPRAALSPTGSQPYIGELAIFAGSFAPAGWAICAGQLMPISENDALFTLIGTTYGGDGESTFALPDLQGRVPLHQGNGYVLAQTGGTEQATLTVNQIPAHSHTLGAGNLPGTTASPAGALPADGGNGSAQYTLSTTNLAKQPTQTTSSFGGSQPHDNMQPYLVINYVISLYGIFPSQN